MLRKKDGQLPLHTFELRSAEVYTQRRGLVGGGGVYGKA